MNPSIAFQEHASPAKPTIPGENDKSRFRDRISLDRCCELRNIQTVNSE